MKTRIVIAALLVAGMSGTRLFSESEEEQAKRRKIGGPEYIEIDCVLSGGMRRVAFERMMFTFVETIRKKPTGVGLTSSDLHSFVCIQRQTRLSAEQIEQLRKWIEKQHFASIERVDPPASENRPLRYGRSLMVYANGREHVVNHHTLVANEQLRGAIQELLDLAKAFTRTERDD